MAPNRTPGYADQIRAPVDIKDGTTCCAAMPVSRPTGGLSAVWMLAQLAVGAVPDAGLSGAPAKASGGGVEMYKPGESPTFDKLSQDVADLGIRYVKGNLPKALAAEYIAEDNILAISHDEYLGYLRAAAGKREELRRSITHELAHARQYKDLLKGVSDSKARLRLLAEQALKMSEDDFVAFAWNNELDAERTAWIVDVESIDFFGRNRGDKPYPPGFLKQIVDQRVNEFADQAQSFYENRKRALYRALKQESKPSNP